MKRILKIVVIIIVLFVAILFVTDKTYIFEGVRVFYLRGNTSVTIIDFKVQDTKVVRATNPQPWELYQEYNKIDLSSEAKDYHAKMQSTAYLIFKDGKILTEHYFEGVGKDTVSALWSITKSYTSFLALKAVEDGLFVSIDDPVSKYVPNWNVTQDKKLTLRYLASMSTGLFWDEMDKQPFSLIAKLNFCSDIEEFVTEDLYAIGNPRDEHNYDSGGTQLLGLALINVLKDKSLTEYLEEKFWQPLGYENDGLFVIDSKENQREYAFGGLVGAARDISRMGQLINNNGNWNNQQILSERDIELITSLPFNNKNCNYGLWSGSYNGVNYFYQSGHLGQRCISIPEYNIVITRLSQKASKKENINDDSKDVVEYIKQAMDIIKQTEKSNTNSI